MGVPGPTRVSDWFSPAVIVKFTVRIAEKARFKWSAGWAIASRNHAIESVASARSFCARTLSFSAYRFSVEYARASLLVLRKNLLRSRFPLNCMVTAKTILREDVKDVAQLFRGRECLKLPHCFFVPRPKHFGVCVRFCCYFI